MDKKQLPVIMIINLTVTLMLPLVFSTLVDSENNPIIETRLGRIEGILKTSRGGREFQGYQGIPYALPPSGELRFEPPQSVSPWEGVFPAKHRPAPCLQYTQERAFQPSQVIGSEDCLYLNVFVPVEEVRNNTGLLPVIIYIYGGGLREGEGIFWGPDYFMDKDIVFVTLNHRLGILGFLSTEDSVVMGNMGLKDQSLAIKWISKNIDSFGGDPEKVTLAGLSSGAASAHFQYLSPMSRGLFHRIIIGSGNALHCWAQAEGSLEKAKKLGMLMECPTSDNQEMVKCLKSRPAESIVEKFLEFMPWRSNPLVPFGPVVEKDSQDPFIDKSPIEIIESGEAAGDLPWMVSVDAEEGLYPGSDFIFYEKRLKYLEENWESIAPHLLEYNYTIPASDHATVARKIRNFYMGDKRIEFNNSADFIRMIGDRIYALESGKFAKKLARLNNTIWFYNYAYRAECSISEAFGGSELNVGVAHTDESLQIFSVPNCPWHSETDVQMSIDLINLWTSFATTGIPDMGVHWPPVERSSDNLNYLRISGPGKLRLESDDNFAEKLFWSTIDFNENKLPSN